MDSRIVSQSPQQVNIFETVSDLITALEYHHGQTFTVYHQHFGGHGSTLIAQSTDHTEMIIARNGRGWMLGCWGKHFGHVDIERTALLYEDDDSHANAMSEYHLRLMDEAGLTDAAAALATRRYFEQRVESASWE